MKSFPLPLALIASGIASSLISLSSAAPTKKPAPKETPKASQAQEAKPAKPAKPEKPAHDLEPYCLALEPKVLQTKVSQLMPGSKSTVLSPAKETDVGLKMLSEEEWKALGMPWEDFLKKSRAAALKLLQKITPQVVKDQRGIVEYLILTSDSPLTSSILLCPELLPKVSETLGNDVVALVPDRFTIYLFPRKTGAFVKHGKEIAAIFATATYPSSEEAFELTETSIKSIGSFHTGE